MDLDRLYSDQSRKVHATLIRLLGDFDLAEEATQEAFAQALKSWPETGTPNKPVAWLISTGRFKAVDILRRRARYRELEPDLALVMGELETRNAELAAFDIQDDRLRLIFTCCHPAIDPKVQVPLTLREVCGLTTQEIAKAYLTSPTAMAQRIVRGKAKIKNARIPYVVPDLQQLPERLDAVLRVIYLVFNEGYFASHGDGPLRASLSQEAIRLARLLLELVRDPEVEGLLALMLFHESRRSARTDAAGDIVLLDDQDRSLWDGPMIEQAEALLRRALTSQRFGAYTLQAAIAGVHAGAASPEATDWPQMVALYGLLERLEPSPVVSLNRAVAVSMVQGAQAGLDLVETLLEELSGYSLAHAARGKWLGQLGRPEEARAAYRRALELGGSESQQRFLRRQLKHLDGPL